MIDLEIEHVSLVKEKEATMLQSVQNVKVKEWSQN